MEKRKSIIFISLAILMILVVSLTGCTFEFRGKIYEYINEEYEANENTLLYVSNINGKVNISSWNEDTVSLSIVKYVKKIYGEDELKKVEINVEEIDNKLIIETVYLKNNNHVSTMFDIKIPEYVTIESVKTVNGGIYIKNIKGDVRIETTNGPVHAYNIDGYVEADVINGPITIRDTTGVSDITSTNGVIDIELQDFKKDIEISTVNGVINVFINTDLDANLKIKSNSITGIISLNDMFDLLDITRLESRYIEATMGEGGNNIYMSITSGNLDLYKLS